MTEPIPILITKVERQLGLVRSRQLRGDPDCPSRDVLEWLADFEPLYDTLPMAPAAPDLWVQISGRLEDRELQKLRSAARRWRFAAAALAITVLGLGTALWTARVTVSPPLVATAPQRPSEPLVRAAPLMATMQQVTAGRDTLFVLVADPGGASIRSTPAAVELHPGHAYRLWVEDGARAVLVGTVSPSISHSLAVTPKQRQEVRSGSRLLVTLDPETADDRLHQNRIVARGQLGSI